MPDQTIDQFYQTLQTLPKLIGDLGLNIAEAQRRLDQEYLENLGKLVSIVKTLNPNLAEFQELFKLIAPSRYQFTETVVEVRADLQMSSATELGVTGSLGIKTPMIAAVVGASYARRSALDYQAAATIRTVINAISADTGVMTALLSAARTAPGAALPDGDRYKPLLEALKAVLPAPAPAQ